MRRRRLLAIGCDDPSPRSPSNAAASAAARGRGRHRRSRAAPARGRIYQPIGALATPATGGRSAGGLRHHARLPPRRRRGSTRGRNVVRGGPRAAGRGSRAARSRGARGRIIRDRARRTPRGGGGGGAARSTPVRDRGALRRAHARRGGGGRAGRRDRRARRHARVRPRRPAGRHPRGAPLRRGDGGRGAERSCAGAGRPAWEAFRSGAAIFAAGGEPSRTPRRRPAPPGGWPRCRSRSRDGHSASSRSSSTRAPVRRLRARLRARDRGAVRAGARPGPAARRRARRARRGGHGAAPPRLPRRARRTSRRLRTAPRCSTASPGCRCSPSANGSASTFRPTRAGSRSRRSGDRRRWGRPSTAT